MRNQFQIVSCIIAILLACSTQKCSAQDKSKIDAYAPMAFSKAKAKTLEWLMTRKPDKKTTDQVIAIWNDKSIKEPISGTVVHSKVINSFQIGNPKVEAFLKLCDLVNPPLVPPDIEDYEDIINDDSEFFTSNLRLEFAQYLTRTRFFDEAMNSFEEINLESLADPATYFFYKGVCEHHLLQREESLETFKNLLEKTERIPNRYQQLATLMKYEMEKMKAGSLNQISRLMSNVERRLGHGRAGPKVQKEEEEIIAALDVIIKKLEKQQGGGQGSGSGESQGQPDSNPADEAYTTKGKAAQKVDKKNLAKTPGWGNLDEKEQAKVKNILGKNFPSHYEKLIEEYSRAAAKKKSK